jgi:hypothetical protein
LDRITSQINPISCMDKSFHPTPNQKDIALGHFLYRVGQLMGSSGHDPVYDQIVHNALVDSTLIHSRALLEFFERESRMKDRKGYEKDDVLLADYGFIPTKAVINPNYKDRLNKDLAHFTYSERVTRDEKKWNYEELVHPILLGAKAFIEHLLQNYPTLTSGRREECKRRLQEIDRYMRLARKVI